ncbi:MAG: FHA domain-containing protein [Lachnospiraceae bacterium]|nr:FHA domain-containing protein [Lachnospiraceae bacterium]
MSRESNDLTIECSVNGENILAEKMLENGDLPGLASMEIRERDGIRTYVYRTGDFMDLEALALKYGVERELILKVFRGITDFYRDAAGFFLEPEGLLLDPNRIFLSADSVRYIYLPGNRQDIIASAQDLCLFFFRYADYEDRELLDVLHRTMSMLRNCAPGDISLISPDDAPGAYHPAEPEALIVKEETMAYSPRVSAAYAAEESSGPDMSGGSDEGSENIAVKKKTKGRSGQRSAGAGALKSIKEKLTGVLKKESEKEFWTPEETDEIVFVNGIPNFVKEEPDIHVMLKNTENKREIHEIGRFPATVGKKPGEADIIIKDSFVEKRHAVFAYDNGSVTLTDLGSVYGTYVNGKKLKKGAAADIRDGDEIGFAGLNYRAEFIKA